MSSSYADIGINRRGRLHPLRARRREPILPTRLVPLRTRLADPHQQPPRRQAAHVRVDVCELAPNLHRLRRRLLPRVRPHRRRSAMRLRQVPPTGQELQHSRHEAHNEQREPSDLADVKIVTEQDRDEEGGRSPRQRNPWRTGSDHEPATRCVEARLRCQIAHRRGWQV